MPIIENEKGGGPNREAVLAVLRQIPAPEGGDIVGAGLVRALAVEGGAVRFVIEVPPEIAPQMEPLRAAAERAVASVPGVGSVSAVLTAHSTPKAPPDLKGRAQAHQPPRPAPIPGVRHIIAIASGKGGVGKSTVAANLACALVAEGRRVGLLDGDIYGPSQPRMMGVSARPASPDGQTIIPLVAHGVTMMSLGLMIGEGQAVIWRGPMLMGALTQMLTQVRWGELDVLIVDLPPGTGDAQMTLAQKAQLDGAIIVSTPQDVALIDARKGIDMFGKLGTPIIGLIENMSTHICSNCGHEEHLFGHGGVRREADKMGVPLLAEIPLHLSIRVAADGGTPVVAADPASAQAAAFRDVARQLVARGLA